MAWISTYGYFILLPLFVIEGPIIGITSGVLISFGALEPLPVFLLYTVGTIITDTIVYYSARGGNRHARKTAVGRWVISRVKEVLNHVDENWKQTFSDNYVSLMVLAKLAPINLLASFVAAAAGLLGISARKFYPPVILAQPLWSAAVIGLGYYLGGAIASPSNVLADMSFVTALFLGVLLLYYWYLHDLVKESQLAEFLREEATGE